jgi:YD repeat-containing protein
MSGRGVAPGPRAAGRAMFTTDPAAVRTGRIWDKAGRLVTMVENDTASSSSSSSSSSGGGGGIIETRTTRYDYTSDGWMKKLISENVATGPQITEWIYGVSPATGSALSSKRLVHRKVFPSDNSASSSSSPASSDQITYAYNRQLQATSQIDQLGTVHSYAYDKLGRLLSDSVVGAFGSGVDTAVGKLSHGYTNRGLLLRSTSYNSAGTTVRNEIAWEYNDFNQPIFEYQEHAGAVNKATSLRVGYTHASGAANTLRPTGIKYPHVGSASATTLAIEYAD